MSELQLGGSWAGGWDEIGILFQLIVQGGLPASGVFVYDPTAGAGTLIVSITDSLTDPYSNVTKKGVTSYGAGTVAVQLFAGQVNFTNAFSQTFSIQTSDTNKLVMTGQAEVVVESGLRLLGTATATNTATAWVLPSNDTTGATDYAAINGYLSIGYAVRLIPGVYYINNGINPTAGTSVVGPGRDLCTIRQTSSAHTGFSWTSQNGVTLEGFTLVGTGSGTSAGVNATGSPLDYMTLRNLKIQSWGGSGVNISGNIVSRLEGVVSLLNGGNGFSFFSSPTSTVFDNCYANANTLAGYRLANCHYVTLDGCACDNNAQGGVILSQCVACVVNGMNVQSNTGTTEQFLMTGGTCNVVNGLFCDNTTVTQSVHLSSTETFATLTGLIEVSPGAGPTAFITTDAGTSCVVINDKHTTANSFSAGTAYEILPTSAVFH